MSIEHRNGNVPGFEELDLSAEDLLELFPDSLRFDEDPIRFVDNGAGRPRLEWSQEVADFIAINSDDNSGCPAHRMFIEDQHGKIQILTYYFWDKLISAMYDK